MSYKIIAIPHFERDLKRLRKKYSSLVHEMAQLNKQLIRDPFSGTPMGNKLFKIRLAVASKGKGSRGGMRVITFVKIVSETIYLISIYDKNGEHLGSRDQGSSSRTFMSPVHYSSF